MNIIYRGIERALDIEGAIAFCFVTTLVLTIEDIEVMAPDMLVVGIEAHAIFRVKHDGEVSKLHIAAVSC